MSALLDSSLATLLKGAMTASDAVFGCMTVIDADGNSITVYQHTSRMECAAAKRITDGSIEAITKQVELTTLKP